MPLLDDPWIPIDGNGNPMAWERAPRVAVFRYDGESTMDELPNVECLVIHQAEGTNPGHSTFRYNLASRLDGAPRGFEQALGTGFTGLYVVNSGDRLVVRALRPDGVAENLFDGLVLDFGMQLGPELEEVILGAEGIAKRAWDDVIGGAIIRNADDPKQVTDRRTDLPAHFNPNGIPNCIPDDYMAGTQSNGVDSRYPTFLDPLVIRDPDLRTHWTLPKAVRYILYNANPKPKYVMNPSGDDLDDLLVSPGARGDRSGPIRCPDTPITGKDWPGTIYRLIADCGFGMNFQLDAVGDPVTRLNLFANQAGPLKKLYLGTPGTPFDPTTFNFNGAQLHRDVSDVVNTVKVKGGLTLWEASFVLAPGFPMEPSDKDAANLKNYENKLMDPNEADPDKYRLYVFDETGDGHYGPGTVSMLEDPPSLDDLLGKDDDGKPLYSRRRRRPIGELISRDSQGKPAQAVLLISRDYAGEKPGLWDGTGHWQLITQGGWELLKDRLGIRITESNPNDWNIGPLRTPSAPYTYGIVHGVEAQADITGEFSNFHLRLTCVIEGDIALVQVAGPTSNSAIPYPVTRTIDASDRYRLEVVHTSSDFNGSGKDKAIRDDSKAALAEAQAIRAGTESGQLVGSVTIPRLTTYYQVGDRISEIEGRGLGLRTDGGSSGTEVYPVVVARSFHLGEGGQHTTLELSDAGTLRARGKREAGQRRALRTGPIGPVGRSRGRGASLKGSPQS